MTQSREWHPFTEQEIVREIAKIHGIDAQHVVWHTALGVRRVSCRHEGAVPLTPQMLHNDDFTPVYMSDTVLDLFDNKVFVRKRDGYGFDNMRFFYAVQCPDCAKVHFAAVEAVEVRT